MHDRSSSSQSFRRRSPIRYAALVLTLMAAPLVAPADTITLNNGETLQGRILEQNENIVRFQDSNRMVLNLPRTQIQSIEEGESPLSYEEAGDQAFQRGNLEEALEAYERAKELQGDAARLDPKIAKVREDIRNRDLGPYAPMINDAEQAIADGRLDQASQILVTLRQEVPRDSHPGEIVKELRSIVAFERGLRLVDEIDYANAEVYLREALEIDPGNVDAGIELAQLYALNTSTRPRAIELYQSALEKGKGQIEPQDRLRMLYEMAELYRQMDDFGNAVRYYGMVFTEDPAFTIDLEETLVATLKRYAEEMAYNDNEAAARALRMVKRIRPEDLRNRSELAELLYNSEKYDQAIAEYEELLEIDAEYGRANFELARCLLAEQQLLRAREYLAKEVEVNPTNYDALVEYGNLLVEVGDFDMAREHLSTARSLNPDDVRAIIALATAERVLGNFADARRYMKEVLAMRPDDPRVNIEMGLLGIDEAKYDEASEYLDKAVEELEEDDYEGDPQLRGLLADALIARGEVKLQTRGSGTAQRDFNRALEVYPEYPAAYLGMGAAYEKKFTSSKVEEHLLLAEENLRKARDLAPENPEYALQLGIFYQEVMEPAHEDNRQEILMRAKEQYEAYLDAGGMNAPKVRGWIEDIERGTNAPG